MTGAAKVAPPSVDLATRILALPVSGQKTKTWPAALVEMLQPMPVPPVSEPLTCFGVAPQVPAAPPVRRLKNTGGPLCQQA